MVLYSAVSSPLDRSKRFTLYPLADLFIPTPFSASLGSILAMQQLRNDYSLTFPPLSIARYSFIQLSRLRRREVKENAQTSKRYQRDSNQIVAWTDFPCELLAPVVRHSFIIAHSEKLIVRNSVPKAAATLCVVL